MTASAQTTGTPPAATQSPDRVQWVDFAKGLCIVAVVSSLWAALIVIYFGLRLSGLGGSSWSEAEHTLLTRRMSTPSRTRTL